MKHMIALCLSLWIGLTAYGQNKFEKGYVILADGTKIECFLKNKNWQNNPTQFEFKRSESAQIEIGRLGTVREFSVPNVFKFVKFRVKIDRSSNLETQLSRTRQPEFSEETLFLKSIVDADVSLYSYKEEKLLRFFYTRSAKDIKQLIYKDYRNDLGQIVVNEAYKIQLKQFINCGNQKTNGVSYATSDLKKYFINYNNCIGGNSTVVDFTANEQKGYFSLGIVGGLGSSSADISDETFGSFVTLAGDIGSTTIPKFGVQLEYVLPYNGYKWSLFAMPTYQSYNMSNTITEGDLVVNSENYAIDYTSIEIPVGVRRYFPINQNSSLFLDAAYLIDVPLNATITTSASEADLSSGASISIGFGYKFQRKYGIELRYATDRNILANEIFRSSNYSNISLLLSYTIL